MTEMPQDWRQLLSDQVVLPYFNQLLEFVRTERQQHPGAIFPDDDLVFNALKLTPVDQVRVVILGQDPHPIRSPRWPDQGK